MKFLAVAAAFAAALVTAAPAGAETPPSQPGTAPVPKPTVGIRVRTPSGEEAVLLYVDVTGSAERIASVAAEASRLHFPAPLAKSQDDGTHTLFFFTSEVRTEDAVAFLTKLKNGGFEGVRVADIAALPAPPAEPAARSLR